MHHDLGALGAAVNRRATERQLQIMKRLGVNAIRTSHNPPSPELLEFCDRLGLVVMDEAFDMWRIPKVPNGYSKYFDEWGETRPARHDPPRPQPSERHHVEHRQRDSRAEPAGRRGRWPSGSTDICHEEDPHAAHHVRLQQSGARHQEQLAENVDIPGFNYKPMQYEQILKEHPDWIISGLGDGFVRQLARRVSPAASRNTRKHPSLQLTSYDIIAPPWAYLPDAEFAAQEKCRNVLGEFVWTGFDYLGEPTPYFGGRGDDRPTGRRAAPISASWTWPGFPRTATTSTRACGRKKPMVHVLPHWNWAGREGQAIPVMAYTNADEVELFLNGKSLGRKKRFSEPVEMPVGQNVSRDRKFTTQIPPDVAGAVPAGHAAGGRVQGRQAGGGGRGADGGGAGENQAGRRTAPRFSADGDDLSFVTVRVEDKDGNLCPLADNLVQFKVTGAGKIAAVDNGNAATIESFQADHRKAFSGLALLIVRSKPGEAGRIHVTANSAGLAQGAAEITAR